MNINLILATVKGSVNMFKFYERKQIVVEGAQWFPYMAIKGVESVKKKYIDQESAQEKIVVDEAIIYDGENKQVIKPGDYVVKTRNGLRRMSYNDFVYDYDEISKEELVKIQNQMKSTV